MARYFGEFSIAGVNAVDAVLFALEAAATDRINLEQVFFEIEALPTNAPIFGLKRRNAVGTGAITSALVFQADPADGAASGALQTAWATARPTVVGGSAARGAVPLALGNGFLFDFTNRPLVVPISSGLCGVVRNASGTTTGTLGGYVAWSE